METIIALWPLWVGFLGVGAGLFLIFFVLAIGSLPYGDATCAYGIWFSFAIMLAGIIPLGLMLWRVALNWLLQ